MKGANPEAVFASCPRGMDASEWAARQELALAYRLFDHFGWHELIFNHITVRVPEKEGQFLINPFGLMYREITASNLVKIDVEGRILSETPHRINPAGFIVHAAIHSSREDAHAVIHSHTTAGQAVSCQEQGLLPLSFTSVFFHERIAHHDFEGITLDHDECGRLAADLGTANVMILRNHGLLTCGHSLAHAFNLHYQLQRACEVQVAAQNGGAALRLVSPSVAARSMKQFAAAQTGGGEDDMLFAAMRRWMIEKDPSFLG
jgi:ribulose-5-phosphate 4-epimerase/fuculose-1-phosphate aldolase